MFHNCVKLKSFATDLPSLTNGYWMFYGCNLTSFNADMPSLVNGERMFYTCSQLNSFSSNLGSLKSGYEMFYDCKLNEESLYNIAETINDITDLDKEIDEYWTYEVLGETETIDDMYRGLMTVTVDSSVTETQKNNFVSAMNKKGWTVSFVV